MTVPERGGVPPDRVWVNGTDKTGHELTVAIARSYTINVDTRRSSGESAPTPRRTGG